MQDKFAIPSFAMDQLPPGLLELVSASLTGFDLFHLSHTNSALLRATSTDTTWGRFFAKQPLPACAELDARPTTELMRKLLGQLWKKQYVNSYSLDFQGLPKRAEDRENSFRGTFLSVGEYGYPTVSWFVCSISYAARRGTVSIPCHFGPGKSQTSLTIDVWFALKSEDAGTNPGGVLLGLQSEPAGSDKWPHYHQQPIVVDSNRQLFCSLIAPERSLEGLACISDELEVNRWYHLAVSYSGDEQLERVYLDGQLVVSRSGIWHQESGHLEYGQVGTGYVTAGDRSMPVPGYVGYYSFHGLVEELRVWEGVVSGDEIADLARGSNRRDESSLWYSLRSYCGGKNECADVQLVRCTRPIERYCEQLVTRDD